MTTSQGYEPQLSPEYTDPQPAETVDGLRTRVDALESDLADVMEERDRLKAALERIAGEWGAEDDELCLPETECSVCIAHRALDTATPGGREQSIPGAEA